MAAGAEHHLRDFDATLDGPGDEPLRARLVCGWSTMEAEGDALPALLR
jgi:threonine aldolase